MEPFTFFEIFACVVIITLIITVVLLCVTRRNEAETHEYSLATLRNVLEHERGESAKLKRTLGQYKEASQLAERVKTHAAKRAPKRDTNNTDEVGHMSTALVVAESVDTDIRTDSGGSCVSSTPSYDSGSSSSYSSSDSSSSSSSSGGCD